MPRLEDLFDLSIERRDLCSKIRIFLGSVQVIQELLANEILQGADGPKLVLDPFRRFALLDSDLVQKHSLLLFETIFAIHQDLLGLQFVEQVKGKMGGDVANGECHFGSLL